MTSIPSFSFLFQHISWLALFICLIPHASCSLVGQTEHNDVPIQLEERTLIGCENDESFNNRLPVEFTGFEANVTKREIKQLELLFPKTYTKLTNIPCIEGSRDIDKARLSRFNKPCNRQTRKLEEDGQSFTYNFRVSGDCQCCASTDNFFGSAPGFDQPQKNLWRKWKQQNKKIFRQEKEAGNLCQDENNKPALCKCPALPAPVFTDLYNVLLQGKRKQGKIVNVHTAETITDFCQDECKKEVTTFEADVAIKHSGDPAKLSETGVEALAQAFLESYNAVNTPDDEVCDPFFLVIDEVEIVKDNTFDIGSPKGSFTWIYRIKGHGRESPPRPLLFSYDVRRNLRPSQVTDRRLDSNGCTCPPTAEQRSPTIFEFEDEFNTNIGKLQDPSIVGNIDLARVTTEVEPVQCSEDEITVESDIFVDIKSSKHVPPPEVVVLEDGFISTYNDLASKFCDPFFRRVFDTGVTERAKLGQKRRDLRRREFTFSTTRRQRGGDEVGAYDDGSDGRRMTPDESDYHGTLRGLLGTTTCFCPVNAIAERAPTADEFLAAYNETIKRQIRDGLLKTVLAIEGVREPGRDPPLDCAKEITSFEADVAIKHSGDPAKLSETGVEALAQAFLESYNTVNTPDDEVCDPFFLVIDEVEILKDNTFDIGSPKGSFTWIYRIKGHGRESPPRPPLFSYDVRRNLRPSQVTDRRLDSNGCTCPPTAEQRSPTIFEFEDEFNTNIGKLQDPSIVGNIDLARVTTEVEPVQCSEDEITVESDIFVDIKASKHVPPPEVVVLEEGFLSTYNDLASKFCDPFFRRVFDTGVTGRAKLGQKRRDLRRREFTFSTTRRQRGGDEVGAYDDGSDGRRMTPAESDYHGTLRGLLGTTTCFCPVNAIAERAPTADEFLVAYNETVQRQIRDGMLKTVLSIEGVGEP